MNKADIKKLLALNAITYPNFYKERSQPETDLLAETWLELLGEYPAELINPAFRECLKTCKFPVTPADIFEKIAALKNVNKKSVEQLWQEFLKAVDYVHDCSTNYFATYRREGEDLTEGQKWKRHAQKYFERLDPEIKRFAGSLNRLTDFWYMEPGQLESNVLWSFRRFIEGSRQQTDLVDMTSPAALQIGQTGRMMIGEGE